MDSVIKHTTFLFRMSVVAYKITHGTQYKLRVVHLVKTLSFLSIFSSWSLKGDSCTLWCSLHVLKRVNFVGIFMVVVLGSTVFIVTEDFSNVVMLFASNLSLRLTKINLFIHSKLCWRQNIYQNPSYFNWIFCNNETTPVHLCPQIIFSRIDTTSFNIILHVS